MLLLNVEGYDDDRDLEDRDEDEDDDQYQDGRSNIKYNRPINNRDWRCDDDVYWLLPAIFIID